MIERIQCDILCVGGSGAAASAAYMASKQGCSVVMMSKGRAGRSGNAVMVGGGFGIDGYSCKYVLGEPDANENYKPEDLMKRIITHSFFIGEQKLARQFVTDVPHMFKTFKDWAERASQPMLFGAKGSIYAVSGNSIARTISEGIKETEGLKVLSDVMAVDLVKKDGRVCGAVGFDIYKGTYIYVEAKAVVLATGGYQPYSLKNTITDAKGDGMAMALRAGADIADMEFLLYIPTAVSPLMMRGSIMPYLFTIPIFMPLKYDVVDESGRKIELPPPFDSMPGSNKAMKLIYSSFWSMGTDADAMRGGLFFDYSARSDQEIIDAFDHFLAHYGHWHPKGKYNGYDVIALRDMILRERRLEFALANEYSNGGVIVDENMFTGVEGLYAAGETTSGLFGAFRAGDGLSEMLAHGYRAGLSAAEYAKRNGLSDAQAQAEAIVKDAESVFGSAKGERSQTLLRGLNDAADSGFGLIRSEAGLNAALEKTDEIGGALGDVFIESKDRRYNTDYLHYLELRNLQLLVKCGVTAARMRKESRGTHIRSDFPQVRQEYAKRICHRLEDGALTQYMKTPDASEMDPPKRDYADIHEYLKTVM